MSSRVIKILSILMLVLFGSPLVSRAQTDFNLGDAANFAVLYEGTGGNTLMFSNSGISGNIGIGGTGAWADSGGCSGKCQIMGVVEFSAANTGQFSSSSGTSYIPALSPGVNPLYSQSEVSAALTTVNSLNSTLGSESGTAITINVGNGSTQTINASSGKLDTSGNEVFTVSSVSFVNGATLTIDGTSSQYVVLNITANGPQFGGTINLTGGITSDQVLFNIVPSGDTLQINTNGATETGTFLDPDGTVSINHSVLDGRLFGGDTQNMSIVSGAFVNAPMSPTPEPGTMLLFGTGFLLIGGVLRRRLA